MNKSKFAINKFILFVSVLIITTFGIAYIIPKFVPNTQKEETKSVAIVGIVTNANNNLLFIDVESIYPKLKYEISKAVVLIDDSTEIVSHSDEAEPSGNFLSSRAPAPTSELVDKNRIYIKGKVRVLTNSSNMTLKLETNSLETKANAVQLLYNDKIVK